MASVLKRFVLKLAIPALTLTTSTVDYGSPLKVGYS